MLDLRVEVADLRRDADVDVLPRGAAEAEGSDVDAAGVGAGFLRPVGAARFAAFAASARVGDAEALGWSWAGVVAAGGLPEPTVAELICAAGHPWACDEALRVFVGGGTCPNGESGGDPAAIDRSEENFGLTQLNRATWEAFFGRERWSHVLEAEANLAMADEVYERGGGWGPWTCRP